MHETPPRPALPLPSPPCTPPPRPALSPPAENQKLVTRPPPEIPPLCLDLAFGTRVCGIRMYGPLKLRDQVGGWVGG